jgi:squalene cyclase
MKFVLNYQETDHCTYWISSVLFIEGESIESVFIELSDLHDNLLEELNITIDSDEYNEAHLALSENVYVPLTDISPDMNLETIDNYIQNIKTIKLISEKTL